MGKVIKMFPRNGNSDGSKKVICNSEIIRKTVSNMLINKGWKFENLGSILSSIGLKFPIVLNELYDFDQNSLATIQCTTADKKEIEIDFLLRDILKNYLYDISVTMDGITTNYTLSYNMQNDSKLEPEVYVLSREMIISDYKIILAYYDNYIFQWYYQIDSDHFFKVELDSGLDEGDYLRAGQNAIYEKVEDYFLSIKDFSHTFKMCADILKITGIYKNEKKNINLAISYEEGNLKNSTVINSIVIKQGNVVNYVVTKKEGTFFVHCDGTFGFTSNGKLKINFIKQNGITEFFVKGNDRNVKKIDVEQVISNVENKFYDLTYVFENNFLDSYILNLIK